MTLCTCGHDNSWHCDGGDLDFCERCGEPLNKKSALRIERELRAQGIDAPSPSAPVASQGTGETDG